MKLIKKYDLYFVFGASIILAIILMIFSDSRDIGSNLFTEMTGVAMTVFVINKILERREDQKKVSIDQRILREVQSIISSYFSIWKHLMWKYMPDAVVNNEQDLLDRYPRLLQQVRLSDQFDVISIHNPESWKLFYHNRTIKDCFINYSTVITEEIQLFINDFKMFMEPELLDKLLNILDSDYFKNLYIMSQEATERYLIELEQDVDKLTAFMGPDEFGHINLFLELHNYSKKLKSKIDKFTVSTVEIYDFQEFFQHPLQLVGKLPDFKIGPQSKYGT